MEIQARWHKQENFAFGYSGNTVVQTLMVQPVRHVFFTGEAEIKCGQTQSEVTSPAKN